MASNSSFWSSLGKGISSIPNTFTQSAAGNFNPTGKNGTGLVTNFLSNVGGGAQQVGNWLGQQITNNPNAGISQFLGGLTGADTSTTSVAKNTQKAGISSGSPSSSSSGLGGFNPKNFGSYGEAQIGAMNPNQLQQYFNWMNTQGSKTPTSNGGGFGISAQAPQDNTAGFMNAYQQSLAPYLQQLQNAYQQQLSTYGKYDPNNQANDTGMFKSTANAYDTAGTSLQNQIGANTTAEQGQAKQVQDLANQQLQQNNRQSAGASGLLAAQAKASGFNGSNSMIANEQSNSQAPYALANQNLTTNTQDTLGNMVNQLNQTNQPLQAQIAQLPVEKQQALAGLQDQMSQIQQQMASGGISATQGMFQLLNNMSQFNQTLGLDYFKTNTSNALQGQSLGLQQQQINNTAQNNQMQNLTSLANLMKPQISTTTNPNTGQLIQTNAQNGSVGIVGNTQPQGFNAFLQGLGIGTPSQINLPSGNPGVTTGRYDNLLNSILSINPQLQKLYGG